MPYFEIFRMLNLVECQGKFLLDISPWMAVSCCLESSFMLGRSNVGKSSLLNSLTRQWGVVRTSDKPGLTQVLTSTILGRFCVGYVC